MRIRNAFYAGAAALLLTTVASPAMSSPGQTVEDLTDGLSAEDLVAGLIGDSTPVSNVTYTGSDLAAGSFSGFDAVGIDSGVVLSTGCVADGDYCESSILGPNASPNRSENLGEPGDPDLNNLLDNVDTRDAAVLEFDFVPDAESVTFTYVFGSEEYPDFVNDDYNDIFAFFVNGTNYATIDGEDGVVPVSIDTINEDLNPDYFRKNYPGDAEIDTELNGLTTVLTFTAPVNHGETNHIKLAIADSGDSAYDSAVLIEAGSFRVNNPPEADDQTVDTLINTPVEITPTGSDPDGDDLTFTIISQPDNGTVTEENGVWVFTPADDFEGTTEFPFVADDGSLQSDEATITINVHALSIIEILGEIEIEQAECVDGEIVGPDLGLPDADNVEYDVDGEISPGETVTVIATPAAGHVFAPTIGDWDVSEDGTEATLEITFDEAPECEAPEDPDPTPEDPEPTPGDPEPTPDDETPAPDVDGDLPETGQDSIVGQLIAAAALVLLGGLSLALVHHRRRLN